MSATNTLARMFEATRPRLYATETYEVLRLHGSQMRRTDGEQYRRMDDAREALVQLAQRGDQFVVRQVDDESKAVTLHIYQVRAKAAAWVRQGFESVRVQPLYADLLASVELGAATGMDAETIARRLG